MNTRKQQLTKILLFLSLFLFFLWQPGNIPAAEGKEKNITIHNGEFASDEDDWSEDELLCVGDTGKIELEGPDLWGWDAEAIKKIEYLCDRPEIVSIDENGNYEAKAGGTAIVTVIGYDSEEDNVYQGSCRFFVCHDTSGMSLSKNELTLYRTGYDSVSETISLKNAPDLTWHIFQYESSNKDMSVDCSFDAEKKTLIISSYSSGSTTLTITINGNSFTITVKIWDISINKGTALLAKKGSATLKLKGYPKKTSWTSTDKKIVSVSASGKITGKKTGNAVVYTTINGTRIGCAVSVVSKKLKKTVNAAKNIAKGKYSQPKRMQKGFYDCSSLVWRAYTKSNQYFGNKTYAPVAADIAKWCISHKKRIKGGLSNKNITKMKLRPGDLFFRTGSNNNRYKGIYHVEMFVGYYCIGFDGKTPIVTVLWATRGGGYGYLGGLMARPS